LWNPEEQKRISELSGDEFTHFKFNTTDREFKITEKNLYYVVRKLEFIQQLRDNSGKRDRIKNFNHFKKHSKAVVLRVKRIIYLLGDRH